LSQAARRSARRRDKARVFTTSLSVGNISKSTSSSKKKGSRRSSLTGGPLRRTEDQDDDSEHEHNSSDDPEHMDDEVQQEAGPGHSPQFHGQGVFQHGYAAQVTWSKELEELKPPQLLKATPEALLDFAWTHYAEELSNIGRKQGRTLPTKSIYDCIEKHNRIYMWRL
jgi:hypothetical protein